MRTLAGVAVIILGSAAACWSFAQAVAEGAMLHANSAAVTTKMGTALRNALSNVMGGNAEKMESISAGKLEHMPHAPRNTSKSGKGEQSSGPLVITSIRGVNKPCTTAQPSLQTTTNTSDRLNTKADASTHGQMVLGTPSAQDCSNAPAAPSPSKSVVNLSFPK